jgi:hypothetical protein
MIRLAVAIVAGIFTAVSFASAARAADPVNIPFDVVKTAFETADCTTELKDEPRENVEELGGGFKLVEVYCWRAAYQAGSMFLVLEPARPEKARLMRFQWWSNKKLISLYSVTEPDFDPRTKMLKSFHKGRGVGDCGSIGEWKWNKGNFDLTRFWHKEPCDGQPFDDEKRWLVYRRR